MPALSATPLLQEEDIEGEWRAFLAYLPLQDVPGKEMAKVVMVKKAGQPIMTVLPASHRVNFVRLEESLGGEIEVEREQEFRLLFPHCET